MGAENDIWQIMIEGQVYEADTETLKQWAAEGRVLPSDKVKKGALAWNEANKVPLLRAIFSGQPLPPTSQSSSVSSNQQINQPQQINQNQYTNPNNNKQSFQNNVPVPVFNPAASFSGAGVCRNHPQEPAIYICRVCSATFCKACPKMMGTMAVCTACGDMCNKIQDVVGKANLAAQSTNFYGQGKDFGATELAKAFQYPFQFMGSLIFGVILYAFLSFGSGFSWLITAIRIAVLFSCMSLTIRQVSAGRMDRNFLPELSSFTFFDDVVKPVLFSIGVIVVAFGPALLVVIIFLRTLFVIGLGTSSVEQVLASGLIALLLGALGILWGIFYYPMAMAIAGFTQDFWSIVNPSVGIDTMRRMGSVYLKAFLMYLVIFAVGTAINLGLAVVLSPVIAVPFFGQMFYNAVTGGFTFYTSIVVACVLGTALYKCADELDIAVDQ